jgi:hypothetical protein
MNGANIMSTPGRTPPQRPVDSARTLLYLLLSVVIILVLIGAWKAADSGSAPQAPGTCTSYPCGGAP